MRGRIEQTYHCPHEFVSFDRFGKVGRTTRSQTLFSILAHRLSGQSDDRNSETTALELLGQGLREDGILMAGITRYSGYDDYDGLMVYRKQRGRLIPQRLVLGPGFSEDLERFKFIPHFTRAGQLARILRGRLNVEGPLEIPYDASGGLDEAA